MKRYIQTFEDFVNEQTLSQGTSGDFPENDWGYYLAEDNIVEHIGAHPDDIEELDELEGFKSGEISTYSTAVKGNFILDCGTYKGKPACMLNDELNDVIKYYIKK